MLPWTDRSGHSASCAVKICVRFSHGGIRFAAGSTRPATASRRCSRVTRRSACCCIDCSGPARRSGGASRGELHDRGGGAPVLACCTACAGCVNSCSLAIAAAEAEVDRLIRVTEETVHDLRTLLADLRPRLARRPRSRRGVTRAAFRANARSPGIPVSFEVRGRRAAGFGGLVRALSRGAGGVHEHSPPLARRFVRERSTCVRDDDGWGLAVEDDGERSQRKPDGPRAYAPCASASRLSAAGWRFIRCRERAPGSPPGCPNRAQE